MTTPLTVGLVTGASGIPTCPPGGVPHQHRVGLVDDASHPRADGPPDDPTTRSPYSPHGTPAPLSVAAGLSAVEGLLLLLYGLGEVLHLDLGRAVMGVTTALFFVACGAGLLLCAWGLHAVRTWARGPVLLAQLIQLGLAWSFREGDTLPVAIGLAVVSAIVLVGVLHPHSIAALERADQD
jgi:hypothetical protein